MKYLLILIAATWLLNGCAAYKQLEPKPPIVSSEGGFLPVRDDDQPFELKKEDKYYIAFPAPAENNFYLVVKTPNKKGFASFLTDALKDETSYGKKTADEYADSAQTSVYAIHSTRPSYYLLMEDLRDNFLLQMEYRYVPQWRFKFVNKYAYYREFI